MIPPLNTSPPMTEPTVNQTYEREEERIKTFLKTNVYQLKIDDPWIYSIQQLSLPCIEHLQRTFTQKGYHIELVKEVTEIKKYLVKQNERVDRPTTATENCWFEIFFSDSIKNRYKEIENPQLSENWNTQCLAKDLIIEMYNKLQRRYKNVTQVFEAIVKNNSQIDVYKFDVIKQPKVIVQWLIEDLKERGMTIFEEKGELPDRWNTTNPYHYVIYRKTDGTIGEPRTLHHTLPAY